MDFYIYSALTFVYAAVIYWVVRRWQNGKQSFGTIVLTLVLIGLLYDNAIIAFGTWIGASPLLESLHAVRFWLHAFLTPLIVLIAYEILQQEHLPYARTRVASFIAWLLTVSLIAYQSVIALRETRSLRAVREFGVIHYTPSERAGTAVMILIVTVVLLLVGIALLLYRSWWGMALGVALMPVIMWLSVPLGGRGWSNVGELVLILSLWITMERKQLGTIFAR